MNTQRRQLRRLVQGGARPLQVMEGLVDATLPLNRIPWGRGSAPEAPPAPQ